MKGNDRVLEVPISEWAQELVASLGTTLFPWDQNVGSILDG